MNAGTVRATITGPAGALESRIDAPPDGSVAGTVVVAHPHPLFGGNMDNKVVQSVARAYVQCGWRAVRFNFRGVGLSAGTYDEGRGEADDLLAVIEHSAPSGALALAGFSFGSFIASAVVQRLHAARPLSSLVLVGTAVSRFPVTTIPAELHAQTLVIHGESDETAPLHDVLRWAQPQNLPVVVIAGASHFFHGQLNVLRYLVARHVAAG
ncbi:MAG: alpha/beta hydrolase [Burkholderiaceae bacterium]